MRARTAALLLALVLCHWQASDGAVGRDDRLDLAVELLREEGQAVSAGSSLGRMAPHVLETPAYFRGPRTKACGGSLGRHSPSEAVRVRRLIIEPCPTHLHDEFLDALPVLCAHLARPRLALALVLAHSAATLLDPSQEVAPPPLKHSVQLVLGVEREGRDLHVGRTVGFCGLKRGGCRGAGVCGHRAETRGRRCLGEQREARRRVRGGDLRVRLLQVVRPSVCAGGRLWTGQGHRSAAWKTRQRRLGTAVRLLSLVTRLAVAWRRSAPRHAEQVQCRMRLYAIHDM